jgi:cysteinyl-tRNA synthetase
VSVNVKKRTDPPGESDYAAAAWDLKERIREEEGALRQRRGFFTDAYRRSTTHLLVENDVLVAFASVRRDGTPDAALRLRASAARLGLLERTARDYFHGGAAGPEESEIEKIIAARQEARAARDFARADALRDELLAMGIELEDTPQGPRWKRVR